MMDKQEVQRRQWRLMGRTALWGVGVIAILMVILEANAPDETEYLPTKPPSAVAAVAPARAKVVKEKPKPAPVVIEYGGKYETIGGGVAALTKEKLELVQRIASQNDLEAFILMIETDPQVVMLDDGMTVWVSEYENIYRRAKVRFQGTTAEAWVPYSALRRPAE